MLGAKVLLGIRSLLTWIKLGNDIDGEVVGDAFGSSVAMNSIGDRVAIGAPFNDGNGDGSGSVRIYSWDGTNWTKLGNDIDGEAAVDGSGRSVAMNSVGDRVAIAAPNNDGNGDLSGSVRIYSWNGTNWTKLGNDIDGETAGDASNVVAMNSVGDRVAIGAPNNDGNGTNSGSVRIYSWDGTNWTKLGNDIDGEAAGDQFAIVAMNSVGDRVAIGSTNNDDNGDLSGSVRIYSWNGTNWTKLGNDIDGEAAGDRSGIVAMNSVGDRVAIGAPFNDGNGTYSGSVRIYSWNGTNWTKLGNDIDGEAAGDQSGFSVSMNSVGDRVAIGLTNNDDNGTNSGSVRIYSWDGTNWTKLGNDIDGEAAGDLFGRSVAMNSVGDRVAIGAPYNDGNGDLSGSVRIYKI
jgi:hypothetical protein